MNHTTNVNSFSSLIFSLIFGIQRLGLIPFKYAMVQPIVDIFYFNTLKTLSSSNFFNEFLIISRLKQFSSRNTYFRCGSNYFNSSAFLFSTTSKPNPFFFSVLVISSTKIKIKNLTCSSNYVFRTKDHLHMFSQLVYLRGHCFVCN